MINLVLSNILRMLFLVFLQITLLNNINLHNTINPYIYVLFILLLPLNTPIWGLLFMSFFTGLIVDSFTNTPGLHTSAIVLMAFCRPLIIQFVTPRGGYENEPIPSLKNMGERWFITYATILVFIHHFSLFFLEAFRLSEFFITLSRVILSCIFTMALILIGQYFFTKKTKR